jgi:hypothetical protein
VRAKGGGTGESHPSFQPTQKKLGALEMQFDHATNLWRLYPQCTPITCSDYQAVVKLLIFLVAEEGLEPPTRGL